MLYALPKETAMLTYLVFTKKMVLVLADGLVHKGRPTEKVDFQKTDKWS